MSCHRWRTQTLRCATARLMGDGWGGGFNPEDTPGPATCPACRDVIAILMPYLKQAKFERKRSRAE